jgi:hypothetical protein
LTQEVLPGIGERPVHQNGSVFKDRAFADNKQLPIHRWVPWIAGFSAAFVDDVLDFYLSQSRGEKRRLVLDPFAGVGTTLIEAPRHGHDYAGFEINPYAALAARAKLQAIRTDPSKLNKMMKRLRERAVCWGAEPPSSSVRPPNFRSRIPFFSPRVERQVLHALEFIQTIADEGVADLFRVAFGAVMVSFSNYTYEPSLGSRPGAGKPLVEDANVAEVPLAKLHQMREDIRWGQKETRGGHRLGEGEVYHGDFFSENRRLPDHSVHLMITSPPYLNNYHYVRNTRPQMYWLSLLTAPSEQRRLEERNFGKFWQTVRDQEQVPLDFQHQELERFLSGLRLVRADAGAYGGPGWANYAAAYFNDCHRFVQVLGRLLAHGGVGLVVIGNSIVQGLEIRTDEILADLARRRGLATEGIHRNREKRVGASITQSRVRRGEVNRSTLYESTVVLRKP